MTTKIIAHRGASKLAPENTMPAFELAYELGAEGIETDVQLTKDNVPILMHDEHVKRTTNGIGYIKDLTLNELKELDAGAWFSPKYAGTKIVTLDEFLNWVLLKPLYLNIELKNNKIDYRNLETIVYNKIKNNQLLHRTTLSTFNPSSVKRLSKQTKDVEIAFLTSRRKRYLTEFAKSIGANALHVKYRLLNQMLVDACHKQNLTIRSYTINQPRHMLKTFALGCDGIFTDVPHIALESRNRFQQ